MKALQNFTSKNHRNKSKFPIILIIMFVFCGALITYGAKELISSKLNATSRSSNTKVSKSTEKSKGKSTAKNADNEQDNSKDETSYVETNKKNKTKDKKGNSSSSGKTWVPPVYKTVHHPAVTRTVTKYSCKGGTFNSLDELKAAQKTYIRKNNLPG